MDSKEFRRQLRKQMTPAEARLWTLLRNRQVKGSKFRRQHTIGTYTVDFICESARLIIELDGNAHDNVGSQQYDFERDEWLKANGYRVLRFSNRELVHHPDRVIWEIEDAIEGKENPECEAPINSHQFTGSVFSSVSES